MRPTGHSTGQREAGLRDALLSMSVTELTFQLDRSELKDEASLNTAREMCESEGQAARKAKGRLRLEAHFSPCR